MADEGVPTKHMRKVRDFTKQIVTLESMVAAKERQAAAIQPFPQASHG